MEAIRLKRVTEAEPSSIKLDLLDKKLLFALSNDARLPLSSLAKQLRHSRDTLQYRLQSLLKKGIIQRFIPLVDLTVFGFNTFHVFLVVDEAKQDLLKGLMQAIIEHPNTKAVMEYTGVWEIEWILIAQSVQVFDNILNDITSKYGECILEKQKIEIIQGYKSEQLPRKLYTGITPQKKKMNVKAVFDEKDIELLKALAKDARQSSYELASLLSLAPNTVRYRLKQLEQSGVIRKYSFVANLAKLDYHWYSVGIKVKTLTLKDEQKLKTFVDSHPYILRAVKVLGPFDLLFNIATESLRDFHLTLKEFQSLFSNIIVSYHSLIGYQEHIFEPIPKVLRSLK